MSEIIDEEVFPLPELPVVLRVLADRLEHNETGPQPISIAIAPT